MANPPDDYLQDELGLDPDDPGALDDLREYLRREGFNPSDKELKDLLRRLKRTTRRLLGG